MYNHHKMSRRSAVWKFWPPWHRGKCACVQPLRTGHHPWDYHCSSLNGIEKGQAALGLPLQYSSTDHESLLLSRGGWLRDNSTVRQRGEKEAEIHRGRTELADGQRVPSPLCYIQPFTEETTFSHLLKIL